jgi:DNA-directed RNA polymerase subunit beta
MFGEEYSLIKPYSLLIARKYSGNYRAQLVIPIEVRNKIIVFVTIISFLLLLLPLMTTYATFIINGCERVIVSQIIRSPAFTLKKKKPENTKTI